VFDEGVAHVVFPRGSHGRSRGPARRPGTGACASAELGVDNLTDSKYFLFHPFPGRTFLAGLKVKL
jgi:hypothetical protein